MFDSGFPIYATFATVEPMPLVDYIICIGQPPKARLASASSLVYSRSMMQDCRRESNRLQGRYTAIYLKLYSEVLMQGLYVQDKCIATIPTEYAMDVTRQQNEIGSVNGTRKRASRSRIQDGT